MSNKRAKKKSLFNQLDTRVNAIMDKLDPDFYPPCTERTHAVALYLTSFFYGQALSHNGYIRPLHIRQWYEQAIERTAEKIKIMPARWPEPARAVKYNHR